MKDRSAKYNIYRMSGKQRFNGVDGKKAILSLFGMPVRRFLFFHTHTYMYFRGFCVCSLLTARIVGVSPNFALIFFHTILCVCCIITRKKREKLRLQKTRINIWLCLDCVWCVCVYVWICMCIAHTPSHIIIVSSHSNGLVDTYNHCHKSKICVKLLLIFSMDICFRIRVFGFRFAFAATLSLSHSISIPFGVLHTP